MERQLIYLLCLVCFLSVVDSREYILIGEYKSWWDARDYCRQKYIDLASAQTDEEWGELNRLTAASQSLTWVGLYDDANSWRWSFQDQAVDFSQWDYDQPNNMDGRQYCVNMRITGLWWDEACNLTCPFFCQNQEGNAVLVVDPVMSWNRAQEYCRGNYTDLFTVKNQLVNQQLSMMIQEYTCAWIGLFRDSWKWSDQTAINPDSPVPWGGGQPDNSGGQDKCATLDSAGQINDERCSKTHYFICQKMQSKQQVLRLEVKAGDNVNNQAISATVLNKVQQKLMEQGMAADVKLSWRKQPNGMVFQKMMNGSTGMNKEL